jgi:RecB family endonuclease NucS
MPDMISYSAQGISTGEGKLNINFVVFELKLSRGADKAMGQISRYMGWIKQNLAKDKGVKGVIVAKKVDEKLKYAASIIPDISLFEYELNFKIQGVSIGEERGV